jgi:hypothetical protein
LVFGKIFDYILRFKLSGKFKGGYTYV